MSAEDDETYIDLGEWGEVPPPRLPPPLPSLPPGPPARYSDPLASDQALRRLRQEVEILREIRRHAQALIENQADFEILILQLSDALARASREDAL